MKTFEELFQSHPVPLDHAALLIAREVDYAQLSVEDWLERLQGFAHQIEARMKPIDTRRTQMQRVGEFLFEEHHFDGNLDNYYDPRNSFLNEVLSRELGIPITLSVVFLSVAERLGIPAYGVGLPGHFIVACQDEQETIYLDPFHKGIILSEAECIVIAQRYLSDGEHFNRTMLAPQSTALILLRILNNLRHIYLIKGDTTHLLRVLLLQRVLMPRDLELVRDIGILYYHQKQWGKAINPLRRYLALQKEDEESMEPIRAALYEAIGKLSRLN